MDTYRADYLNTRIDRVEIASQTKEYVTPVGHRREARSSQYYSYHGTREAAKQDILARLLTKKGRLLSQLDHLEIEISKANDL